MTGVLLLLGVLPARAEVLLSLGSGAYWYQVAATTAAVDQFLGRPEGSGSGGSDGLGGRGSLDANGPLRLRHHNAVALTWRHGVRLTHRLDLVGDVRLEYGRTRWFIKDGIDILRDDLTARLAHISITPTLGLRTDLYTKGPWHSDITGGIGATRLAARTQITSALLDVRRTDYFSDSFAFVRLELGRGKPATANRALLEAQWRRSTGVNLRLGIAHKF
ncbi:hypothetical protein [uncultured Sulfitobacter sp.]|uniref:hypothetical protein n=1 Tax=uncultured Sulfitobacter sp. TaxID=191468 RepID=UPI0026175271|nr:hypothetical protein [uncultured Sulfitobacter sp.]